MCLHVYIHDKIMTQLMICSSFNTHYDSVLNEKPKPIMKHVMFVGMLESKEFVGNHTHQQKSMRTIFQLSQAHNILNLQFQIH